MYSLDGVLLGILACLSAFQRIVKEWGKGEVICAWWFGNACVLLILGPCTYTGMHI